MWEKDVISNREARSDSGSSSRKPSLVDFPDLGTSSSDEEEEPIEQQNGLRRPRRGSKIVQQKAMLFGGVKWKASNGTSSASSSTSSSPVGSLTTSPALIDARARKLPTKAKDEIVRDADGATSSPSPNGALRSSSTELPLSPRPYAASSPASSASTSPRSTKKDKKDKKAAKQTPKMKKEKERSRDQPRGTSVEEDLSRASSTAGAGGGGGGPGVSSGKDRKEDRDTIRLSDHSAPFEFDPENLHYIDQKAASGEYSPHQRQGGEERSSPTTPPGKKKRARALTDMGRPALPLLRLRTDSRETAYPIPSSASPSSPSSSSSASSSACSLSLEPVPDEWGTYHHSPSSPSRGTNKSPRSANDHVWTPTPHCSHSFSCLSLRTALSGVSGVTLHLNGYLWSSSRHHLIYSFNDLNTIPSYCKADHLHVIRAPRTDSRSTWLQYTHILQLKRAVIARINRRIRPRQGRSVQGFS